MKIAPKVRIGFPVYNGANTIDKVINSLLTQTFKDFELIIYDNASNDKTGNICRRFASIDSRIHYVRQDDNIGPFVQKKYKTKQLNVDTVMRVI